MKYYTPSDGGSYTTLTTSQAITAEGKEHAIAIGKMTMSAEEM